LTRGELSGKTAYSNVLKTFILTRTIRDALDATVNYGAHAKFVEKWLDQLETEN
jgi:hypothetical protein